MRDAEASTPTAPLPTSEAEAATLTHDAAAAVVAALQEAAEQDAAAADITEMLPEAAVAAPAGGFAAPAAADMAQQELYNTEHALPNDGAQVVQQAAAAGVDADTAADALEAGADDMIVDYDHPYYGDEHDQNQQYYGGDDIEPEEHFLDAEGESSTAAEADAAFGSTGTSGSDSGVEGEEVSPPATEQQHEPSWSPGSSEDDGRTAAVVS